MRIPVADNKTIKADDMTMNGVIVEVDGKVQSMVTEARTGRRGYVTFIERDRHNQIVKQNGKLVYKTLYGNVIAWQNVKK